MAVVDDSQDAADALALLLTAWGHPVKTAYDGWGRDELAQKLHAEGVRPTTLVAVTGYGHEADVARAKWVRFD